MRGNKLISSVSLFKKCATIKLWLPELLLEERAVINLDTGLYLHLFTHTIIYMHICIYVYILTSFFIIFFVSIFFLLFFSLYMYKYIALAISFNFFSYSFLDILSSISSSFIPSLSEYTNLLSLSLSLSSLSLRHDRTRKFTKSMDGT